MLLIVAEIISASVWLVLSERLAAVSSEAMKMRRLPPRVLAMPLLFSEISGSDAS